MNWYTLYTKPHAEQRVRRAFQSRGLDTYLPTVPVWRARRRRMEDEPLFACYLFARIDFEQVGLSAVTWTPGLRYVVGGEAGSPTPVPAKVVDYIRRRAGGVADQGGLDAFTVGEKVRVAEGPFKELEAVFQGHLSGYERAQVLINVLGRLTRYDVPTEWLRKS